MNLPDDEAEAGGAVSAPKWADLYGIAPDFKSSADLALDSA